MMCLGWDNNPICKPPDVVQVVAPVCPQTTAIAPCPDITWFWLTAAAIGAGAMLRGANAPRSRYA